jgi:hypothetical protein
MSSKPECIYFFFFDISDPLYRYISVAARVSYIFGLSSLSDVSPDFIRGKGSQFHEELLPDFAQYCFKSRYGIYKTQLLLQVLLSEAMS